MGYNKHYKIMFGYKGANIKQRIQDASKTVGWNLSKQNDWGVLVSLKSTNTPPKSTRPILTIRSMEMSQLSTGQIQKILIYLLGAFHARPSLSPGNDKVLMTQEAHSFLKSLDASRKNNHAFYFLKMLKGYYLTAKAKLSELSSIRWMNLGMTFNGKCLTVKTSVSPRIGNECSLSDILEEQVDQKYFLSEKAVKAILNTSGELLVNERNG